LVTLEYYPEEEFQQAQNKNASRLIKDAKQYVKDWLEVDSAGTVKGG
jgi:hypothetical protein